MNATRNPMYTTRNANEFARNSLSAAVILALSTAAHAGLPTGGVVAGGQANITQTGNTTTINQSTGTLAVRGVLPNADRVLLPGYFVRVRVPFDQARSALLVPDVALGSDQSGRYVLVVNKDGVVEQRKVQAGPIDGELRVIESGLQPDDRVVVAGLLRAIPGQKVDPQLQKIETPPAPAK